MSYELMTDDQVIKDIAQQLDLIRRTKKLKDTDVAAKGGTNRFTISKFRRGASTISLKSFIKFLRGLGELERLESALSMPDQYSPTQKNCRVPDKRVRDRKTISDFTWGEDK